MYITKGYNKCKKEEKQHEQKRIEKTKYEVKKTEKIIVVLWLKTNCWRDINGI